MAFLLPLVAALSEIGLATAVRLTATTAGRYVVSGATAIAAGEVGVTYRFKTLENAMPRIVAPLASVIEKPGKIVLSNGMSVSEAGQQIIKWGSAPEGALENIKNIDAIYLKEVYNQLKKEDFKAIANWYRGVADYLAKHNMDALKNTPTPLIRAELMDKIVDGAPK